MRRFRLIVIVICALFSAGRAMAGLGVGDKAPSLTIAKWAKGEPVDLSKAAAKDVYVVEFWATWCGPCKASIPHMSELQEHFKERGVKFIGISNAEPKVVQKFLNDDGWDAKMRYTVAIDKENKTGEAWMKAAGKNGIPCAFVVKEGKIEWIGHPMMGMDAKVAELCGDTKFAEDARKFQKLMEELQEADEGEEWDDVIKNADKILAIRPKENGVMLRKYQVYATKKKNTEDATRVGRDLIAKCDDAQTLNQFAWEMLTEDAYADTRDIKLALAGAKKAMELTDEKDAAIIDTYARALVDSGDLKKGIEYQRKAVELAGKNARLKAELEKSLADYEKRAAQGI